MVGVTVISGGPVGTNGYLAFDGKECIIIDPPHDTEGKFEKEIEKRGLSCRMIVNTHGHFDHVGANAALANELGCPIACHPLDAGMLERPGDYGSWCETQESKAAVKLEEGGSVRVGGAVFTIIHTPGHTPGSVVLYSRDEALAFTGDLLFKRGFGRYDLQGGDVEKLKGSLARILKLPDGTRVLAGHGGETTIGSERKWLETRLKSL